MTNRFPKFSDHDSVQCFNCGHSVLGGFKSGNARNRGQFKSDNCSTCTMKTWYDLIPQEDGE